jgi:hypothetical protein
MEDAPNPTEQGTANARQMLTVARRRFQGAFIMPPFGNYRVLQKIL